MTDAACQLDGEDTGSATTRPSCWWSRFQATRCRDTGAAWRAFAEELHACDPIRWRSAIIAYTRAARRDPVDFPSRHAAGELLRACGRAVEAEAIYRELLTINPHDAAAAGQLGHILVDKTHARAYHEAEGLLRRALDLGADPDSVLVPLGRLLSAQEREAEIVALTEGRTGIHAGLQRGQAQAALGDFAGARASLHAVLRQDPDHPRAWYHVAGLDLMDGIQNVIGAAEDTDVAGIVTQKACAADGGAREWFAFAAAYALERRGAYADAWAWYREANDLVRARLPSNVAAIEDFERRTIETYTAPVLNRLARQPVTTPGPAPVFVVGMPRSGTTLMERIIGAHPQAAPLGERADLQEILAAATPRDGAGHLPWPERAARMSPVAGGAVAGAYYARVAGLAPAGTAVAVDKMPEQFQQIGLIAATMPQAKIIHMTRDPRDTGVSCYTARFHDGLAWSFDLTSIARRQASYEATMAHWRRLIPTHRMLEVPYAELVRAPADVTARVLEFLGLEWDRACLDGHAGTGQPVRTSSVAQVRASIADTSVGRWERFGANAIGPLTAAGEHDARRSNTE